MKKWKCDICMQIIESDEMPKICPVCKADSSHFSLAEESEGKVISKDEKYVIIGGSAAGLEAAKVIVNGNDKADVTIINKEEEYPYNRPGLSNYVAGKIDKNLLYMENEEFFKKNNIDFRLGISATGVDTNEKKVSLSNGESISYDKLLFANGSSPFVPFEADIDNETVFSLRTMKDSDGILEKINKSSTAIVIGGGILGIEALSALVKQGLKTTVIEYTPNIMGIQLDDTSSEMFRNVLENEGVTVLTGKQVTSVKEGIVSMKDEEDLSADLIIICAGVKSNIDIIKGSGIDTNRGIIIDDMCKTNVEDVFACGDIAEYKGRVTALWSNAVMTGKVAGSNMIGKSERIEKIIPSTVFNGFGVEIFSIADTKGGDDKEEMVVSKDTIYKKIVLKDGIIVGGILYNDVQKSKSLLIAVEDGLGKDIAKDILE